MQAYLLQNLEGFLVGSVQELFTELSTTRPNLGGMSSRHAVSPNNYG